METKQDIIDELLFNSRYLNDDFTKSKYYRGYLKKAFNQLIEL